MERDREQEWLDGAKVRDLLFERLTRHAARPAGDLERLATALRVTSEQLESSAGSEYVGKAADGLHRFASLMKEADAETVLREVKAFALREPALFIGGALLAGFGGGRFLRSSARTGAAAERTQTEPARLSKPSGRRNASTTERTRRDDRDQTQAWDEAEREEDADGDEQPERQPRASGARRIGRAT